MAIKPPVKTVDEAFNNSCKKNGLSVKKRNSSRKSMEIKDEKDNVYIISDDLSISKKITKGDSSGKKRNKILATANKQPKWSMENVKVIPSEKRTKKIMAAPMKMTKREILKP